MLMVLHVAVETDAQAAGEIFVVLDKLSFFVRANSLIKWFSFLRTDWYTKF